MINRSSILKARFSTARKFLVLLVFLPILFQGCAQSRISPVPVRNGEADWPRRIAIFPIQRIDVDEILEHAYRCPISGTIVTAGNLELSAEAVVEDELLRRLDIPVKYQIVPPERVNGVFQRISSGSFKMSTREMLLKSGRELNADAVIYGYVYRFRERKGYAYGIDQAASVAFAMHLVSVRDGSLLWKGIFDKTQTSLMENVLQILAFYKEGGRWITARELTDEGMAEILESFPGWQ